MHTLTMDEELIDARYRSTDEESVCDDAAEKVAGAIAGLLDPSCISHLGLICG